MSTHLTALKNQVHKIFRSESIIDKGVTSDCISRTSSSSPDPLVEKLTLDGHHSSALRASGDLTATRSKVGVTLTHPAANRQDRKHALESLDTEGPASKARRINPSISRETSAYSSNHGSSPTSHNSQQATARLPRTRNEIGGITIEKLSTQTRNGAQLPDKILSNRNDSVKHQELAFTVPNHRPRGRAGRSSRPAHITPPRTAAEKGIHKLVLSRLKRIPGPPVKVVNEVDGSSLPLSFNFIDECIIREGVSKAEEGFMSGCNCRAENGRHVGCEYTSCECLEFANAREHGRKKFPYYCTGPKTGCLRQTYLETRDAIFECNDCCNCGPECKNRNVQKGRQIPLEIFKTSARGWGLRCPEPLRAGQFVDIYKGEIITSKEADQRESRVEDPKNSYLYTLDKFVGEENGLKAEDAYIVDGEYLGGPTRFMNHSCQPNCRQFTASYNHGDMRVYDLAFFTIREISAGTELTFDYLDKDADEDGEDNQVKASDRKGERGEVRPTECLCGAKKCRKWLWM